MNELAARAREFCEKDEWPGQTLEDACVAFAALEREAAVRAFLGKAVDTVTLAGVRFPDAAAITFREMFGKELTD